MPGENVSRTMTMLLIAGSPGARRLGSARGETRRDETRQCDRFGTSREREHRCWLLKHRPPPMPSMHRRGRGPPELRRGPPPPAPRRAHGRGLDANRQPSIPRLAVFVGVVPGRELANSHNSLARALRQQADGLDSRAVPVPRQEGGGPARHAPLPEGEPLLQKSDQRRRPLRTHGHGLQIHKCSA